MGRKKNREPITVRVFYPETEELMEELKNNLAKVMVDIATKQLGEDVMAKVLERMKEKRDENRLRHKA
ncbi:MAG: hypothetical protein Q8936_16660 [Bacillota bacterium]|nr:hypothetical protein [Bacillota bacterium]